jgi:hypothetical protein
MASIGTGFGLRLFGPHVKAARERDVFMVTREWGIGLARAECWVRDIKGKK